MASSMLQSERRTTVDEVFDHLHQQIATLQMKPGDRISEAEIAAKFGVSRQPVRDAFSRLANLDLLLIRPQRATEVRRFSMRQIEKARFVRVAIETEVLRRACVKCTSADAALLDAEIAKQRETLETGDVERFGKLDYEFHKVLCAIAGTDYAFEVVLDEKAKVDRLCMLGLEKEQRIPDLVADHSEIADAVKAHDVDAAIAACVKHLSRLNDTIARIKDTNANFFERAGT